MTLCGSCEWDDETLPVFIEPVRAWGINAIHALNVDKVNCGDKGTPPPCLAELYGVPTRRLNEQAKRNRKRFPTDFMFQLTLQESDWMRSQIATASLRNVRFRPYAFTEHGVAMLSSVLNSDRAIVVNVLIMRAFIRLSRLLKNRPGMSF